MSVRLADDVPQPGLNIAGYFRAELGIGEAARRLVAAVDAAGIPFQTVTYTAGTESRQQHPFEDESGGDPVYDTNLICVNAGELRRFAFDVGPELFAGRYSIGFWWWEAPSFPRSLHPAFGVVDEVWVGSEFTAHAVGGVTDKPVVVVPLPVPEPPAPTHSRAELGAPDGFLFLFVFDFFSAFERKNPLAVIEAFTRAFEPGEGPRLLIKSINGDKLPDQLRALRDAAGGRDDVRIVDGYLDAGAKDSLIASCDCYVSLHRSEGFGLTLAEAMAYGKPVVATRYSGNLDFMNAANSYLVHYTLRPIPGGAGPYPPDAQWADPDVEHAARILRHVYDVQDEARAVGERARESILASHSVDRTAAAIRERLEQIRADRRPARRSSGWQTAAGLQEAVARAERVFADSSSNEIRGRWRAAPVRLTRRLLVRLLAPYLGQDAPRTQAELEALRQLAVAYQVQLRELDELRLELADLRQRLGKRDGAS